MKHVFGGEHFVKDLFQTLEFGKIVSGGTYQFFSLKLEMFQLLLCSSIDTV